MMVNPYDDSRLMLALQIDHSRVAGFFAAHWGNQRLRPSWSLMHPSCWRRTSTTSVGGNGR